MSPESKSIISVYRAPFSSISRDSEIASFESDVSTRIKAAPDIRLAIDLSKTFHVSSQALGLLVAFRRQLNAGGGKLVLFGANAAVKKVFEITRLAALVPILDDQDAAVAFLKRE